MITTIGSLMVLSHDIHYGYEGGYVTNFTIESKEPLSDKKVRGILEFHFNQGMSVNQRKYQWLDFMPTEEDFNCELEIGKHNSYASEEVRLKFKKE